MRHNDISIWYRHYKPHLYVSCNIWRKIYALELVAHIELNYYLFNMLHQLAIGIHHIVELMIINAKHLSYFFYRHPHLGKYAKRVHWRGNNWLKHTMYLLNYNLIVVGYMTAILPEHEAIFPE